MIFDLLYFAILYFSPLPLTWKSEAKRKPARSDQRPGASVGSDVLLNVLFVDDLRTLSSPVIRQPTTLAFTRYPPLRGRMYITPGRPRTGYKRNTQHGR